MPDFSYEQATNAPFVVGIDEVGYGPWAGPLVATGVHIPEKIWHTEKWDFIQDSKKLSLKKRQFAFDKLHQFQNQGLVYKTVFIDVDTIDRLNVLEALKLAFTKIYEHFSSCKPYLIIDGTHKPKNIISQVIKKGDQKSISIAAASIIAKVSRDQHMEKLSIDYPAYHWQTNMGYGTAKHQLALHKYGVSPHHRKSYKPIQAIILGEKAA